MNYFSKLNFIIAKKGIINSNTSTNTSPPTNIMHSYKSSNLNFITGCILVSSGIMLAASGGSFDITNHLLNKPETFFSPPHAILYGGIASATLGSVVMLLSLRSSINHGSILRTPVKLASIGISMLLAAGPFDFAWHSAFGLDGLLSPPHFILVMGMLINSSGALLGIVRYNNYFNSRNNTNGRDNNKLNSLAVVTEFIKNRMGDPSILIIIGLISIWLATSGLIYMFSLPFSDTKYFNFNPDPTFAAIFSTLSFPFLISLILYSSFELTNRKFGTLSVTGAIFLTINTVTAIVPNGSLIPTIPFYIINIIPIIAADLILSIPFKRTTNYIVGALIGSSFFMIYYPLITHTYNEVFTRQPVWPSLTLAIYFGMIGYAYPLVVGPAIVMGVLGVMISSKIVSKTIVNTESPIFK
jgi:hypothetical protein